MSMYRYVPLHRSHFFWTAVCLLLAAIAFLVFASDASACHRCGLFGHRCRYHVAPKVVAVAPYVAPVVVKQPDVFVVQNNYPQPLVAQGASQYISTGYQAAVLPLFDPNRYASQAMELQRAVNGTQSLMAASTTQFLQQYTSLQAPAVERLAAGQAAQMVLQAAGLDPAHNSGGTQQAVVISRDAAGRLQVLPLTAEQSLSIQSKTTITPQQDNPFEQPQNVGRLTQFCGKCHGINVAAPKGDFYLGNDANVAGGMKAKFFEIQRRIRLQGQGQMPPAGEPQPSQEDKVAILDEIEAIILQSAAPPAAPVPADTLP